MATAEKYYFRSMLKIEGISACQNNWSGSSFLQFGANPTSKEEPKRMNVGAWRWIFMTALEGVRKDSN